MAQKTIQLNAGQLTEVEALVTSAGAGDAGKVVATDSAGKLDPSLMPTGIGADTSTIVASENLSAGDFVNMWNDGGTIKVRKADASNGRRADGFVLSAFSSAANATVYHEGSNTQLSGLTLGATYYLSGSVAGGITTTAPSTSGHIVQEVGRAAGATRLTFEPQQPITLA